MAGGASPGSILGPLFILARTRSIRRVALKDLDLGLDVGGVDGGLALVQGVGFLDVEEVLIEGDDFERGADLVDRGLGEGNEEADDGAQESDEEESSLAAAENAPVFEEAAGFGFGGGIGGIGVAGIGVRGRQCALVPAGGRGGEKFAGSVGGSGS